MRRNGFTLIELVMVLVLIGIVAVIAIPRLGNLTSTNSASFAEKLRADIRYAQNLAMMRNQRYRVYFNGSGGGAPASGYIVVNDTNGNGTWGEAASGEIAQDPATGGNLSVTLNTGQYAGITAASTVNPIEFNSLGRPSGGATTVTVTPVGSITISAETGAVN